MPDGLPLAHVELVDRVYQKVKQLIFDQELKPGQKLVQEKLAEQLGVSRSPLLKALQKLESEFLVENIPRRGMYVRSLSLQEIHDIFQCRAVIEGLSARLAAKLASPDDIKELVLLFTPFQKMKNIDPLTYAVADRNFHNRIMHISGNAMILKLEMLSNIHLRAYQAGLLRPPEETLDEHFAIIEAISRKKATLAERLMRNHIEKSIK